MTSSDSTQRPLCFVTQSGIVGCRPQRLLSRLCLRADASQRSGREDTHIEEFILQSFDELRHCRLRSRADACEGLTRRPSNAGNGIAQGFCQGVCRFDRVRTDGRQSLRRVDADVWILVRKRIDESAYRRAGTLAQSTQGTCGIACDDRVLVSQCPSQCRLNPFCVRSQVNQFIDGAAPDGVRLMPQQVYQQWNGRRTDPLDDFKSHHVQVFMPSVEESSQQRQRTRRPLDQGGFGGCADLRVGGLQAIGPVTYRGGASGKTRLCRGQRRLGQRDRLAEASSKYDCESTLLQERHHVAR